MSAPILLGGQLDKIPGAHDDGSADGITVVKTLHQGLVRLPLYTDEWLTGVSGTATVSPVSVQSNLDGTQRALSFTVPAVTSGAQSAAWVEQTLYGRRIGVRFRRNNSASLAPFTLWVDGVPYAVRETANRRHRASVVTSADYEGMFLVADDLGPGPHTVRLSMAGDVVGGSARSLIFYGWLVDRAAGYEDRGKNGLLPTSVATVPATATVLPAISAGQQIRKVYFHNTDSVTRTVTISVGSTDILKVITLATGVSGEIDFSDPVLAVIIGLRFKADAANVVNYWVQERI